MRVAVTLRIALGLALLAPTIVIAIALPPSPAERYGAPAESHASVLFDYFPASLELWLCGIVAMLLVGAALGMVRARLHVPVLGELIDAAQLLLRAAPLPVLVAALWLIEIFVLREALPYGIASLDRFDLIDRLRHLTAPVGILAIAFGPWSASLFRAHFLRSAATGNPLWALRMPAALSIARIGPPLIAATFLVEPIFAWPGIVRQFEYHVVERHVNDAIFLLSLYWAATVLVSLIGDLLVPLPGSQPRDGAERQPPSERSLGVLLMNPISVVALCICGVLSLGAFASFFAGNPNSIDQAHWVGYPLAPGVAGHPLGTDESGRDLLSRLLVAIRTSGIIVLGGTLGATLIASAIAFAHWIPWLGRAEALAISGIRPLGALVFLLFPVVLGVAHRGNPAFSIMTLIIAIALVSWPSLTTALRTKASASSLAGAVLNIAGAALLLEVTLSMFGYGVHAPEPSLGNMLVHLFLNIGVGPWIVLAPSLTVTAALCALYALGDALLEPRTGA